jgi:hypothetical protein
VQASFVGGMLFAVDWRRQIGDFVINSGSSTATTILARAGLAFSVSLLVGLYLLAGAATPSEAALRPHTGTTCAQTAPFPYPSAVVGIAETPDDGGYWIVTSGGYVAACGDAPYLG